MRRPQSCLVGVLLLSFGVMSHSWRWGLAFPALVAAAGPQPTAQAPIGAAARIQSWFRPTDRFRD